MAVGTVFAIKPLVLAFLSTFNCAGGKLEVVEADDVVGGIVFAKEVWKLRFVWRSKERRQDRANFLFVTLVKTIIPRQVKPFLLQQFHGVETEVWRRRFLTASNCEQASKEQREFEGLGIQRIANSQLVLWPSKV